MMLARTVEHTVDVDGMLERMTPEQFDEWMVLYTIEPWGIEPAIESEEQPKASSLTTVRAMIGV